MEDTESDWCCSERVWLARLIAAMFDDIEHTKEQVELSRLILPPLKLVPPGTHFSEIFGPTLKNLFPL